jgi:superfamily I DNA/RNA helicase
MLDKDQDKIANHYGSNLLVLAGAGSGKTATVTHRGARLIKAGLDPRRAMMMTFTNKAAKEMRTRMIDIFTRERINQDIPNITTYHQFGYRLIKKYHQLLHFNHGMPTILSEGDAMSEWVNAYLKTEGLSQEMLKEIPAHKELPERLANIGLMLDNNNASIEAMQRYLLQEPDYAPYAESLLMACYNYMEFKYGQNVLDFNDMILLPIKLLKSYPNIQQSISNYLLDVVVDESQDNNNAQYELLKLLTDTGRVPTMMIGDADQSIYEWRGAKPDNLRLFLDEFNAQKFVLERNYRSNNDIVQGAQALVSNNVKRLEKHAYSEVTRKKEVSGASFNNKTLLSDSILYTRSEHVYDLGRQIAKSIKEFQNNGGDISEVAVLYRSQRMGFFMDKALRENGIPTVMIAGTGLMERKEALLALAALRLKANPFDRSAFKRIAQTIPGIGEKSIESVLEQSKEQKKSLLEGEFTGLKPNMANALIVIREMMSKLSSPEQILDWIKENMLGYLLKESETKVKMDIKLGKVPDEYGENQDLFESKVRSNYLNLLSTIETIKTAIENQINEKDYQDNVWEVLTDLSLDAPQSKKEATGVKLSTIHSFKGLEASEVHIAGFTDGLMPLRDKDGQIDNPEEERRLAYVAVTRAKDSLYIHHLKNYDQVTGGIGQQTNTMRESLYLKELVDGLSQEKEMRR